ncbi:MAG: glycosyltransferase family 4 protein [Alphaproteobacteria bacterium]|nr:glycosyltransferase family 4 protein [Alphaproteobacteria bacterium]
MKIAYLNPDLGIPVLGDKGASVHVREFVTSLVAQGHEVVVVCACLGEGNAPPPARIIELPADCDDGSLKRECAAQQLPFDLMDMSVPRRELRWLGHDRDLCARTLSAFHAIGFCPDLIYERHALFHSAGADLARRLGAPRILEVNAPLIHEQREYRGLVLAKRAAALERASFKGADRIVAVSDQVADYVVSAGFGRDRVLTIPNGVDTSRFRPNNAGEDIRSRLGLGSDPVVGFIGSFKPWHGIAFLIKAFAEMTLSSSSIRLLCVGEGPELETARAKIVEFGLEGRAVFTARIPHMDIPLHLAAMDVSVAPYPSNQDFYFSPLKVVESLAVGIPVIASRIGQLEHLVDDGQTGLLFTPGDEQDFVAKTLPLIDDKPRRHAMSLAARRRAVTDFSWERATGRVIAVGRQLVQAKCAA